MSMRDSLFMDKYSLPRIMSELTCNKCPVTLFAFNGIISFIFFFFEERIISFILFDLFILYSALA